VRYNSKNLIISKFLNPKSSVIEKVESFLKEFSSFESECSLKHLLFYDKRSEAYYLICHIKGEYLKLKTDIEAVLDPAESEEYKLNRGFYIDNLAYKIMEEDALLGRSFEDLVIEYDESYRSELPLKVFGGQHRIKAITEAVKRKINVYHGARIYFDLSLEQKFNIALVNNTSIAVSNDLLDRMQEDLLGVDLRNWCQEVGLLKGDQNFADKRSPEGIPTVRIARTLLVNFFMGKNAKKNQFYLPIVCTSGIGTDKKYSKLRDTINWKDNKLKEMGEQFTLLHKIQRQRISEREKDSFLEFMNKAIHPCVVASWAYTAGLFQRKSKLKFLKRHYDLSKIEQGDPLNATALSKARDKAVDPDNYRGLGARINNTELGRMFCLFYLHASTAKKLGINDTLANSAIKYYIAQKADKEAKKAIKRI
jgi:hypothetical protein